MKTASSIEYTRLCSRTRIFDASPEYEYCPHSSGLYPGKKECAVEITVHAVQDGKALCGFARNNLNLWPEGHLWAPIRNVKSVTCVTCRSSAENILFKKKSRHLASILERAAGDDWQVRELEQQQLLEGIISSLHQATGDENENYAKIFGGIAQLIVWHMSDDIPRATDDPIGAGTSVERTRASHLFRGKVNAPIRAFVGPDNEEERRYLLGALLEKIIVTIRTSSSNAYNAKVLFDPKNSS
jgi:hypothetical protein